MALKPVVVVTLMLAMPLVCDAASFDCTKAQTPIEKAVCSDAELSTMDEQLADSYQGALAQLSTEGKRLLRDGQRQWLVYLRQVCTGAQAQESSCLHGEYLSRLKDMKTGAQRLGPFLFSRIDYFKADRRDEQGQLVKVQVSVPRIDAPLSLSAQGWNADMAERFERDQSTWCESPGDIDASFEVRGASADWISVNISDWQYCHGTPHGHGGTTAINEFVTPRRRDIRAADLFKQESPWVQFLTERSIQALRAKSQGAEVDPKRVLDVVERPDHWTFSREGLTITINPYEVLAYVFGYTEILVPWADMKPYLAAGAPLPDAP